MTVEMAGGRKRERERENRAMERRVRRISEEKFGRGGRRGLNTPHRLLGRAGDKPPLWKIIRETEHCPSSERVSPFYITSINEVCLYKLEPMVSYA
jgi:hypothetical protein